MRGRRPEPAEVKAAKGNPGKRRVGAAPDTLEPLGLKPPRELDAAGRAMWNAMAPELDRNKFMRATDRQAFARYCDTLARYWEASSKLRKGGKKTGVVYETTSAHGSLLRLNPWFHVQERLSRRLTELEDRFGLNPMARQQILLRLASAGPQGQLPLGSPDEPAADGQQVDPRQSPIGILGGSVH